MTHDTRSQGRKKSTFIGKDSILSSDTFDFVRSGTNFKIPFSDLAASLGALGTLEQEGAVTGTPVLDGILTEYKIRSLEDGFGVKSSVSPENGITLDHNFQQGSGGVDVLKDPNTTSPTIRSIAAGTGITVGASNGSITISATGGIPTTDIVIVNSVSDFPTPVANVITLEASTTYSLQGLIDIGANRLVVPGGVEIFSENRLTRGLTSDNVGAMITASDGGAFVLRELLLIAQLGSFFDLSGGGSFVANNVLCTGSSFVSSFGPMFNISLRTLSLLDGGSGVKGFLWTGTHGEFNCDKGFYLNWDGTLFDFGTAVFSRGMILGGGCRFEAKAGTTAIDGAAASANISSGSFGLVYANKFNGDGTALSTILSSDARWVFHTNQGIPETRPDGLVSLTGNATETVIGSIGVPVLTTGTWVCQPASQFDCTVAGRLTYTGESIISLPIDATFSIAMASGGTQTVSGVLAKNGVVIPETKQELSASSSQPDSGSSIWQVVFTNGDFIELFVANETNTTNLVVNGVLRIN